MRRAINIFPDELITRSRMSKVAESLMSAPRTWGVRSELLLDADPARGSARASGDAARASAPRRSSPPACSPSTWSSLALDLARTETLALVDQNRALVCAAVSGAVGILVGVGIR